MTLLDRKRDDINMSQEVSRKLVDIYKRLYNAFGPQFWWPAKTSFEVVVGAILTQNTNWGNVEKALTNLRKNKELSPAALRNISYVRLAELIRPAGYFNVKAKRLKNFMDFFFSEYKGNIRLMKKEPLPVIREKLLNVNGIGPETADSILLYALDKPTFVVDAYTKRIFSRHGIVNKDEDYHEVQELFVKNLKEDIHVFNEYHALIVRTCKEFCRTRPICEMCPLKELL